QLRRQRQMCIRDRMASLKIKETYFTDEAQKLPSFGTVDDLESETNEGLAAYYQEMITHCLLYTSDAADEVGCV
ncbi:hypothetical protein KQJ29_36575, partial [Enterococcus sp. S181_ASV_20]|nr:hypothetical protein [Enterococcus sp. S181_ASV_20]